MAGALGADVPITLAEREAAIQQLKTESRANATNETFEMRTGFHNRTTKQIFAGEQKIWVGTRGTTPVSLAPDAYVQGIHSGPLPDGVKFGRVYYDAQEQLPTTRKFIVAFDSPAGKVYAETGPTGPVDWNVVEDRLSKSDRYALIEDEILGGKIEIGIEDNDNGYANFMEA